MNRNLHRNKGNLYLCQDDYIINFDNVTCIRPNTKNDNKKNYPYTIWYTNGQSVDASENLFQELRKVSIDIK